MPEEHEKKNPNHRKNDDMGPFAKEPVKAPRKFIPSLLQRTVDSKNNALIDIITDGAIRGMTSPSKTAPTVQMTGT